MLLSLYFVFTLMMKREPPTEYLPTNPVYAISELKTLSVHQRKGFILHSLGFNYISADAFLYAQTREELLSRKFRSPQPQPNRGSTAELRRNQATMAQAAALAAAASVSSPPPTYNAAVTEVSWALGLFLFPIFFCTVRPLSASFM
jgi:hypothetical protein